MSTCLGFSVAVRDGSDIYVTVGPGPLSVESVGRLVDQLERAAAMVTWPGQALCAVCGKAPVNVEAGYDTCAECLERGV